MAEPVTATVTELPESRVRVQAEVPAAEVEKRVAVAARALGRNLRIPGFRKGKVPPPVIIQRVGREAVLDEAVRESIAGWYTAAIDAAKVVPVGEPNLDLDDLPGEGEPLRFSIEIGVRPEAKLGKYEGLEVGRRDPEVPDEAIDNEIDQLRDRMAKLETVERAAATGDYVVMDFLGTLDGEPFGGGEGRDQMVELGSGRLVPGFEEQLEGASAGDERTVKIEFPEDYGAEDLAGKEAEFAVTVKEVKAKELPELDEDFAAEAGFDTLDELRDDIRERLSEAQDARDRGRVPRGRARRRRRRRHDRGARRARRGPRARAVGPDGAHALPPGHPARDVPADRGQDRGRGASPTTRSPPSATCAARPCWPPSSRPRASRRATTTCSSRSSAPPRPRAARRRSCSSGCAPPGASSRSRPTSPSARRSTTSPSPRSRRRSS